MKRSIKITFLIIPQNWIDQIKSQIMEMQERAEEGIDIKSWSSLKQQIQMSAKNILSCRKTFAMICFFPVLLLGLLVPLLIILLFVLLIILMIPFMIILFIYNLFAKNKGSLDIKEAMEKYEKSYVEDLPSDFLCKNENDLGGTESVTSNEIEDALIQTRTLDLHRKRKLTEDQLKNIVSFVLSLNSRKFEKKVLNMNDMKLTDPKLEIVLPMAARFQTLKIGGEQQLTENGLAELTKYLRQNKDKNKLRRLEIHGTKVESFQFAKKAAEDLDKFGGKREKKKFLDGICETLPFIEELSLNRLITYAKFDALGQEADNLTLWNCINYSSSSLSVLSIQDCGITDSIVGIAVEGFLNIHTLDLSKNRKISPEGWRQISNSISEESKLKHLIYQHGSIKEETAKALSDLFPYLTHLDLSRCKFEGGVLQIVLEKLQTLENQSDMKIEKITMNKYPWTKTDEEFVETINQLKNEDPLVVSDS